MKNLVNIYIGTNSIDLYGKKKLQYEFEIKNLIVNVNLCHISLI